jgi:hypothetical protein
MTRVGRSATAKKKWFHHLSYITDGTHSNVVCVLCWVVNFVVYAAV